ESNEKLLNAVRDAETSQRGFLLTGEERYLDPYNIAVQEIPGLLASLDGLTRKYRIQYDRVSALRNLIPEKMEEMRRTIQLRREDGLYSSLEVVRTDQGNKAMQQIRTLCSEIGSEEYSKAERRSAASSSHGQNTR